MGSICHPGLAHNVTLAHYKPRVYQPPRGDTPPVPTDKSVVLRRSPAMRLCVAQAPPLPNEKSVVLQAKVLASALTDDGVEFVERVLMVGRYEHDCGKMYRCILRTLLAWVAASLSCCGRAALKLWSRHLQLTLVLSPLKCDSQAEGLVPDDSRQQPPLLHSVHVFSIQKDEYDLLADWAAYHLRLLPPGNIHLVDNNSTHPAVLNALSLLRDGGVHVVDYAGSFRQKSEILSDLMQAAKPNAEFLVPLDIDEFLVALDNSGRPSANPQLIESKLAALPRSGHKFKLQQIDVALCNRGTGDNTLRVSRRAIDARMFGTHSKSCSSKTFYPAHGFNRTDQGNHFGYVDADVRCVADHDTYTDMLMCEQGKHCYHISRLAIAHFGITAITWDMYKSKMLRAAAAYSFVGWPLDKPCTGVGVHYCRFYVALAAQGEEFLRSEFETRWHKMCLGRIQRSVVANAVLGLPL